MGPYKLKVFLPELGVFCHNLVCRKETIGDGQSEILLLKRVHQGGHKDLSTGELVGYVMGKDYLLRVPEVMVGDPCCRPASSISRIYVTK